METWYRACKWDNEIDKIEVYKVTPKMLVVKQDYWGKIQERRIAKQSYGEDHFPTKEEAITFKRTRLEGKIESHKDSLANAEKKLAEFNEKYPKGE